MLDLICNREPLWLYFACWVVPTGVDAIVHAALHVRGEAVANDQHIAFRRIAYLCKSGIEEVWVRLGSADLLRNNQLRNEWMDRRMQQAAALDGFQAVGHDRDARLLM